MQIGVALWLSLSACTAGSSPELPDHFPDIVYPPDNLPTADRIALGRKLFYDPVLSLDSTISCASCHIQSLAFTDGRRVSGGIHGTSGFRNSPTLTNVAFQPYFFFDGGIPTLEKQGMAPLHNPAEMGINIHQVALRLREDAQYAKLFLKAYGRTPDAFSIIRALAAFQRSLLSYEAPIDRWWQGDSTTLTAAQQRGFQLFQSDRLGCATCHNGPNLSNYEFRHNGLSIDEADPGRMRVTTLPQDAGLFKVPTLRNIMVTAPYMHNGSMTTLQEVIIHYASGGVDHKNKDAAITGFSLTDEEQQDLLAFFQALTDTTFLTNPAYADPR